MPWELSNEASDGESMILLMRTMMEQEEVPMLVLKLQLITRGGEGKGEMYKVGRIWKVLCLEDDSSWLTEDRPQLTNVGAWTWAT